VTDSGSRSLSRADHPLTGPRPRTNRQRSPIEAFVHARNYYCTRPVSPPLPGDEDAADRLLEAQAHGRDGVARAEGRLNPDEHREDADPGLVVKTQYDFAGLLARRRPRGDVGEQDALRPRGTPSRRAFQGVGSLAAQREEAWQSLSGPALSQM